MALKAVGAGHPGKRVETRERGCPRAQAGGSGNWRPGTWQLEVSGVPGEKSFPEAPWEDGVRGEEARRNQAQRGLLCPGGCPASNGEERFHRASLSGGLAGMFEEGKDRPEQVSKCMREGALPRTPAELCSEWGPALEVLVGLGLAGGSWAPTCDPHHGGPRGQEAAENRPRGSGRGQGLVLSPHSLEGGSPT